MPETSNKVFENLNLEISLKEDYAKILEGLNNKKIFIDITIMPNNDSKPIFERLTEDTEEILKSIKLKRLEVKVKICYKLYIIIMMLKVLKGYIWKI